MNNLSSCPKNGKGLKRKKKMKKVKVLGQGGRGVSSLDLMVIFNKNKWESYFIFAGAFSPEC